MKVPPAKHGVKCRYCELSARMYVIDTDDSKSPVCADHYTKRIAARQLPSSRDSCYGI